MMIRCRIVGSIKSAIISSPSLSPCPLGRQGSCWGGGEYFHSIYLRSPTHTPSSYMQSYMSEIYKIRIIALFDGEYFHSIYLRSPTRTPGSYMQSYMSEIYQTVYQKNVQTNFFLGGILPFIHSFIYSYIHSIHSFHKFVLAHTNTILYTQSYTQSHIQEISSM